MVTLWVINLNTASEKGFDQKEFCLKNNILAVGWKVDKIPKDFEEYIKLSELKFSRNEWNPKTKRSWKTSTNAIYQMKENDLCWTRDYKGNYYLGRIIGPWEYKNGNNYDRGDCHNIRSCKWIKIGTMDLVPGRVITLLSRGTVKRSHEKSALLYSKYMYNKLQSEYIYELDKNIQNNHEGFFSLLNWSDIEDIIGIYVQIKENYYIIPSTCKSGTEKYEFFIQHKEKGIGAVQVKNGEIDLTIDEYSDFNGIVFLFTTKGKYKGKANKNIICLDPSEIYRFVLDNRLIMPKRIQNWLNILENIS